MNGTNPFGPISYFAFLPRELMELVGKYVNDDASMRVILQLQTERKIHALIGKNLRRDD